MAEHHVHPSRPQARSEGKRIEDLNEDRKKAVVLLSGGLDSATVLAVALRDDFDVSALSFRYGQRHAVELEAASEIAKASGISDHRIMDIDMRAIGGSALTDDIAVPRDRSTDDMSRDIPVTYVPARNTVFLSLALGLAEVVGAYDIFIGANVVDYSGYPDCRPAFMRAFERVADLATKAGVEGERGFRIHAPLIDLTKAEIIRLGARLGVDYAPTLSCYDPTPAGAHCGRCDACGLRAKGFSEAGIPDPTNWA